MSQPAKTRRRVYLRTFRKEKTPKHKGVCSPCAFVCAHIYFLYCRTERCNTDQGFALGSFQFGGMHCSRADVAAVRGYYVVSMVRLGVISCTYLFWSAFFCGLMWWPCSQTCGRCCSSSVGELWVCRPLSCCWTLLYAIKSTIMHVETELEVLTWSGFLVSTMTGDELSHKRLALFINRTTGNVRNHKTKPATFAEQDPCSI